MRRFTCSVTIDVPRERVFDYLADIANHVEFSDHYVKDFRLERLESRGVGAAARFRTTGSQWWEIVIAELEPPYRIRLEGRTGRLGRVRVDAGYTLTPYGQSMTRVEFELATTPATRADDLRALLGGRAWLKHQSSRALRRLAEVLERGEPTANAVRVAAG